MSEHTNTETATDHDDDRVILHVTIGDSLVALNEQADNMAAALRGDEEAIDGPRHRLNVHSTEQFQEVFNATNIGLLQAIVREQPASIRELARVVDRDVSPVHRDLERLEAYGLVTFERGTGRAKRPIVPYDGIEISMPLSTGDRGPDQASTTS